MSLADVIKTGLESLNSNIRPGGDPDPGANMTLATSVSTEVANWLMANSTSTSNYAGGGILAAVGTFSSWTLQPAVMANIFVGALNSMSMQEAQPDVFAAGFANGATAMISAGVLEENVSGTAPGSPPPPFSGTGVGVAVTTVAPVSAGDLTLPADSADDNLTAMAAALADAVIGAFPATTTMVSAGPGTGTLSLTG